MTFSRPAVQRVEFGKDLDDCLLQSFAIEPEKCAGTQNGPDLAERFCTPSLIVFFFLSGCGSEPPKPTPEAAKKAAETTIPQDVQDAATALLGSDTQVLLYGDLAKNGQKQMLAANVVPNTPKSTVAGTVVTRAIIAENVDGKWTELFRADEYLKNQKGYLALTPLQAVTGWKIQYENSPDQGMSLYFTPVQQGASRKNLADCGSMESCAEALPIHGSFLPALPE